MKAIIIIGAILAYLFLCFCIWALVYVGAGGEVPIIKRRKK